MSPKPCDALKGGSLYMGSRNVTISGLACQPWAENSPHQVDSTIKDNQFVDGSIEAAKNYCRNPGKQDKWGVWCYTMDPNVTWEFCDTCPNNYVGYNGCVLSDKGEGYKGVLNRTRSFQDCHHWKDHPDEGFKFPDGSAEDAQNFCRNPNSTTHEAPWCFITELGGETWDYCDICTPFEGRIVPIGNFGSSLVVRLPDMNRLCCFRWCVTSASCLGVVVGQRQCYSQLQIGEQHVDNSREIFHFERTCNRKTGGKKDYFVDYIGVRTENLTLLLPNATIEQCDDECIKQTTTCLYYEYTASTSECRSWFPYCCQKENDDDGGVLTRLLVQCDPSLEQSAAVHTELREETTKPTEQSTDVQTELRGETTTPTEQSIDVQEELRGEATGPTVPIEDSQVENQEEKAKETAEQLTQEAPAANEAKEPAEQLKLEAQTTKEAKESGAEKAKLEAQQSKSVNEAAENPKLESETAGTEEPSESKETTPKAEKGGSGTAIIIVVIVLLVVALGVAGFAYYKLVYLKGKDKSEDKEKGKAEGADKGKVDAKGKDKGIGKVEGKVANKGQNVAKVEGSKGEREKLIPKNPSTSNISAVIKK